MATAPGHNKTLDQFERESERNRAALAATIDDLRATVIDEVADFRRKISLGYLTSEASSYARETGSAWTAKIQASARANPLRSLAIGAGLALPLAGLARRIPVPVMLIGAGIALARPGARSAVSQAGDHVGDLKTRLGGMAGDLADTVADGVGTVREAVSSRLSAVSGSMKAATDDGAAGAADGLGGVREAGANLKSQVLDSGAALVRSGSDMMSGAGSAAARATGQTARATSQATTKALDVFHDNPLLVAGAGIAIGALFAAIIPTTDAESRLLEKTVPDLKRKATDLIDDGYQAASGAVGRAIDGTAGRAKEQGLSVDGAAGAADSLGDKLGAVIEAVAGTRDHGPGSVGTAGDAGTREHS